MHKEIQVLQANNTWSLVLLPSYKKPISYKWVYKLKLNPDRTIDRYKAWLVAKGYNQVEGVDCWDLHRSHHMRSGIKFNLQVSRFSEIMI